MSDKLIDEIEEFLADGGEADERIWSPDGKPVYGTFTEQEMRDAYGDAYMDDFWVQFRNIVTSDEYKRAYGLDDDA